MHCVDLTAEKPGLTRREPGVVQSVSSTSEIVYDPPFLALPPRASRRYTRALRGPRRRPRRAGAPAAPAAPRGAAAGGRARATTLWPDP